MRISRRMLSLGALAALVTRHEAARAWEGEPLPTLPLSFAVPELNAAPVVERRWVAAQVGEAQRLMAPHGVSVATLRQRSIDAKYAQLETADDRDALAALLEPSVINVFVVASLRDVDDPTRLRGGVRWRLRRDVSKDYVIVAANSFASTLAHELGHFLGNGHSSVVDNIMSYKRLNPAAVAFDEAQGAKLRRVARQLLASKKVLPIDQLRAAVPSA